MNEEQKSSKHPVLTHDDAVKQLTLSKLRAERALTYSLTGMVIALAVGAAGGLVMNIMDHRAKKVQQL